MYVYKLHINHSSPATDTHRTRHPTLYAPRTQLPLPSSHAVLCMNTAIKQAVKNVKPKQIKSNQIKADKISSEYQHRLLPTSDDDAKLQSSHEELSVSRQDCNSIKRLFRRDRVFTAEIRGSHITQRNSWTSASDRPFLPLRRSKKGTP